MRQNGLSQVKGYERRMEVTKKNKFQSLKVLIAKTQCCGALFPILICKEEEDNKPLLQQCRKCCKTNTNIASNTK